jgi:hypothetical protein
VSTGRMIVPTGDESGGMPTFEPVAEDSGDCRIMAPPAA